MPTPREQLASILKQSRVEAGFDSHGVLAKRLNVSRPVVSKAENPAQPVPSDALLAAWAGVTGVPLDSLTDLARRAKSKEGCADLTECIDGSCFGLSHCATNRATLSTGMEQILTSMTSSAPKLSSVRMKESLGS